MVPIINSRAYSVGPILESHHVDCDSSNFANVAGVGVPITKYRKFSNCANEANQCQARIHHLEHALGLMQNELDRLQKEQQYSEGSSDADSWSSVNCGTSAVKSGANTKKARVQYDKISVWPSTMFDDLVQRWKDQPPKPLPRTASLHDKLFRARSMAPHQSELHRSNTTATGGWNTDRATSAPPAPPPPIFRR